MRHECLISVVLPTYNRAALLPRSIRSVLGQSCRDLELFIVDDGSEDETAAIIGTFDDDRIQYLKLPRNRGIAAARNAGMARARGAYVAFQDSDDEWHPEKLERQLRALNANRKADVVYSDMRRVEAGGRIAYMHSPTISPGRLVNPQTRFWETYMLAMQPVLVRRECVRDLMFDESLALYEDLDFHLRLAGRAQYHHLKEPLVTYYENPGLTTTRWREFKARRQLLVKYARPLLLQAPSFIIAEAMSILCRRSLMPIVDQHLTPL